MYIFKSKDLVKALGIFSFFIGFSSIVEGAQQVVEKKAATQSGGAGSQATRPEAPNKAQAVELERSGVNDLGSPATTTVIAKIKHAVPNESGGVTYTAKTSDGKDLTFETDGKGGLTMIGLDPDGNQVRLKATVQKHLDGSLTVKGQGLSMTNPYSRTAYDIKPEYDSTTNMTTLRVWTADGYVGAVQAPGNINSAVDVSFFMPDLLDLVNPASAPAHNEP